jgi:hypothetical protein
MRNEPAVSVPVAAGVSAVCARERVVLVDADPCVDGARITVVRVRPVALPDALEARVDELARRHLPPRQERRRFDDARVSRIAHRLDIYVFTFA